MNRSEIRTTLKRCGFTISSNYFHFIETRNGRIGLVKWNMMNFMKSGGTVMFLDNVKYDIQRTEDGNEWFVSFGNCKDVPMTEFLSFCKTHLKRNNKSVNYKSLMEHQFQNYKATSYASEND